MQDLDETFTETSDECLSETATCNDLQNSRKKQLGVLTGFLILDFDENPIEAPCQMSSKTP